ncbi:MAG TPA: NAD(P)-dependent oxidoreductase [Candidatus Cloacimonadota bacterium]|nr:NAD(P)-dependent oxidoreductase [Candidatus Cloacimonadota bacterium]
MKRVLVSGANGFVGSRLCNYLAQKGYNVIGLVREGSNTALLNGKVTIKCVDYHDKVLIQSLIDNTEIMVHCAAQTKARSFEEICKNNVDLTCNLVHIANQSEKLEHFIFISSQAAGGPGDDNSSVKETDIPQPVSWYGKSKLLAEKNIQRFCKKNWTILRSASIYGPGDKDFLAFFQLVNKHIALHPGTNDKYISLIYIDDCIRIIETTMNNEKAFSQVFYCSDGRIYTIKSFINNLALAMGKIIVSFSIPDYLVLMSGSITEMLGRLNKKLPIFNEQKATEFKHKNWLCSNSKLVNTLGFKPRKQLLDNLSITYNWYKLHNWIKD